MRFNWLGTEKYYIHSYHSIKMFLLFVVPINYPILLFGFVTDFSQTHLDTPHYI